MSRPRIDVMGQTFGRLRVLTPAPSAANREARWLCLCECGNEFVARGYHLRAGFTRSCGCLKTENHATHGHTRGGVNSPTYTSWLNMRTRCTNPNFQQWKDYGGRGITVCERWDKFENFLADMGQRPEGTTLDRIDGNGNYEPDNCCWATWKEQQAPGRRRRPTR